MSRLLGGECLSGIELIRHNTVRLSAELPWHVGVFEHLQMHST